MASRPRAHRYTAIFLDRDGVINENRPDHVKSWSEFKFLPGAREAIARLSSAGLPVFVVSNQAIVNRGVVSAAQVDAINEAMVRAIQRSGGHIAGIAYCPHRPEEACGCRKPQPGLLLDLAREHRINLREALFVGDAVTDVEAGRAAGCATMLVLTGRGRDQLSQAAPHAWERTRVAADLAAVASLLLSDRVQAQPDLNARASWIDVARDSNSG